MALCQILLRKPDMLLLDEPTNHLDAESVAWLERHLAEYKGTVVAVTHDRYFLDNVAGWILELDRGAGIPWEGNYSSWLEQKDAPARPGRERVHRPAAVRCNTSSSGSSISPRARHAKGKARINDYEKLLAEEQAQEARRDPNEIHIPPGPRLGDLVVEAKSLSKAYGDNVLMDKLSFMLPRGGIVGVIGPNGAGKTTLFRMIVGQEKPDARRTADRRNGEARLCRPEPRDARGEPIRLWEEISDGGKDLILIGKTRGQFARLLRGVQLQRRRSAEKGA